MPLGQLVLRDNLTFAMASGVGDADVAAVIAAYADVVGCVLDAEYAECGAAVSGRMERGVGPRSCREGVEADES